jgi:hypothetical protein
MSIRLSKEEIEGQNTQQKHADQQALLDFER